MTNRKRLSRREQAAALFEPLDCGDQNLMPLIDRDCWYSGEGTLMLAKLAVQIGPEAITLGAIRHQPGARAKGETFVEIDRIVAAACRPRRTVEYHIAKLIRTGWLENLGRQRPPHGRIARRSNTLRLTKKTLSAYKEFMPCPRWLLESPLTWNETRMLMYLATQQRIKFAIEEERLPEAGCADDRESRRADQIIRHTGMDRKSFRPARCFLMDVGAMEFGELGDANLFRLNTAVGIRFLGKSGGNFCGAEQKEPEGSRRVSEGFPNGSRRAPTAAGILAEQLGNSCAPVGNSCAPVVGKVADRLGNSCARNEYQPGVQPSSLNGSSEKNLYGHPDRLADSPAPDKQDHFLLDQTEDAYLVAHLCKKLGISEGNVSPVWMVACWLRNNCISENTLWDAVRGVQIKRPNERGWYFLTCVTNAIGDAVFESLKSRTKAPQGFDARVPVLNGWDGTSPNFGRIED